MYDAGITSDRQINSDLFKVTPSYLFQILVHLINEIDNGIEDIFKALLQLKIEFKQIIQSVQI